LEFVAFCLFVCLFVDDFDFDIDIGIVCVGILIWIVIVIVKAFDIKKLSTGLQERYRLIVSDGGVFHQAMLATQLNQMVIQGSLANFC